MAPIDIRFGYSQDEYLLISVFQCQFPQNEDFWDGNWLVAAAEVSVGVFTGKMKGYLRTDEFLAFQQELIELYRRLTGTAYFSTMEGWLAIQLTGDGLGHIEAACLLKDDPAGGNKLTFTLEFDQTYIPQILKELTQVIQTYPIVGRPPA